MEMRVQLNEKQVKKLIESELYYEENQLQQYTEEVKKLNATGLEVCTQFYSLFKMLSVGDVLEEPNKFRNILKKMEVTSKSYTDKWGKYFDIVDSFELDLDNRPLMLMDKEVSELDRIQTDMDNIKDMYSDYLDIILDGGGNIENKFTYYEKQYPTISIGGEKD